MTAGTAGTAGAAGAVRLRVVGGTPTDLRTAPGRLRRALAALDGTRSSDEVLCSLPSAAVSLGFDRVVLVATTRSPVAAAKDSHEATRLQDVDLTGFASWCRPRVPAGVDLEVVTDPRQCAAAGALLDDDTAPPGYVLAAVVVAGDLDGVLYGDLGRSGDVPGVAVVDRVATFAVTAGHVLAEARLREQVDRVSSGRGGGGVGTSTVGVPPAVGLSRRESEVVRLMAVGRTNAQIGRRLEISEATVKSHVKAVFRKLGAVNRADAVARWLAAPHDETRGVLWN